MLTVNSAVPLPSSRYFLCIIWPGISTQKERNQGQNLSKKHILSGLSTTGWNNGTHPQLQVRNILTEGRQLGTDEFIWSFTCNAEMPAVSTYQQNISQKLIRDIKKLKGRTKGIYCSIHFLQKYSVHHWGRAHRSYWIRSNSILDCLHLKDCLLTQSKISIFSQGDITCFFKAVTIHTVLSYILYKHII